MTWYPCRKCTQMVFANRQDPVCDECRDLTPRPLVPPGAVVGDGAPRSSRELREIRGADGLIHGRALPRPLPPPDRPRSPYGTRRYRDKGGDPRTPASGGLPSLGKRYS